MAARVLILQVPLLPQLRAKWPIQVVAALQSTAENDPSGPSHTAMYCVKPSTQTQAEPSITKSKRPPRSGRTAAHRGKLPATGPGRAAIHCIKPSARQMPAMLPIYRVKTPTVVPAIPPPGTASHVLSGQLRPYRARRKDTAQVPAGQGTTAESFVVLRIETVLGLATVSKISRSRISVRGCAMTQSAKNGCGVWVLVTMQPTQQKHLPEPSPRGHSQRENAYPGPRCTTADTTQSTGEG